MKILIIFSIFHLINTISINLTFKDEQAFVKIRKIIFSDNKFYSCFGIKNVNTIFSNESDLNYSDYQMSCIQFKRLESVSRTNFYLESSCYGLHCDAYKIDSQHKSISERRMCPLNGTLKQAKVFIHKRYNDDPEFNKMYIVVDGCFFMDGNGVRQDVYWVMTDHTIVLKTVLTNIYNNEWVYSTYLTEDIYFNEFDRNCSNLCEKQICYSLYEEIKKPIVSGVGMDKFEYSIESLIYFIVIFIVIFFMMLVVYCLKKRI